ARGQASDIKIAAERILKTKETLNKILAENSGQKIEKVEKDTDRDTFLSAEEAKKYGLIDKVYAKRS
ncbi:MAG: ATP-dependent Clp protease proteolytic subunit, partial [Firmicutes bacterium]|nr:ATP-dependent Clp protease proteolytic subunit [Bacillota bacterium]